MATAFEVAAVFALKDEASAVLRKMSEEVKIFTRLVKEATGALTRMGQIQFKGLYTGLEGLSRQAQGTETAFLNAFAGIDAVAAGATRQITALTGALKAANTQAAAMRTAMGGGPWGYPVSGRSGRGSVPAVGGGSGGGGRSFGGGGGMRGSYYIPGPSIGGVHAGFHGHGGTAAMAGAGLLGYGLYEEAQLEDSVAQMIFHASLSPSAENKTRFRGLIQNTASATGYGYHDIGEAATNAIRLMRGAPNNGLDILPELLMGAATESRLKGTDFKASMKSLVEMAHMTKEYDPQKIKEFMPYFSFLSIANPATPEQMVRAASYAMPTLQSMMNIDPADILMATTALARSGATNTKAGTWVRAGFERALPPRPETLSDAEYGRRMYAMRKIGLVDEKDKSTVLDSTGKHIDIDKMLSIVDKATKLLSLEDKNSFMKKVFGEQGERGIALLMSPAVREQSAIMKKEYPGFKEQYAGFWDFYSQQSPMQKTRQTWQDLINVLSDVGTVALPPVVSGLKTFAAMLKDLKSILPIGGDAGSGPKSIWEAMTRGASTGAVLGGVTGLGVGAVSGPGMLATGAAGMGAGALVGAAVYGGAYMMGIDPDAPKKAAEGVKVLNPALDQTGPSAEKAASGVKNLNGALQGFMNSWGALSGAPGAPGGPGASKMNFIAPSKGGGGEGVIHANIHIDGEKVAHSVSRYQVAMATHPNAIGPQDSHGSYMHPGTYAYDSVGG